MGRVTRSEVLEFRFFQGGLRSALIFINRSDASVGNAFNENQVKSLPMEGRNVPDLLSLQAGVAYTGNRPDINKAVDTRSGAVKWSA